MSLGGHLDGALQVRAEPVELFERVGEHARAPDACAHPLLRAVDDVAAILVDEVGFGFRVSGCGFRVSGCGFRVSGFGFRVSGYGSRVSGCGFRVSGCGFRVSGFGYRDKASID